MEYPNWLKFSIILSSSLLFWMVFIPVAHGNDNNQGAHRATSGVQQAKSKTVHQTKKIHPRIQKKANRRRKNKTAESPKVTANPQTIQAKVESNLSGVGPPTVQPVKTVEPSVPQGPVVPGTLEAPSVPPATTPGSQDHLEEARQAAIEAKVGVFITSLYGFDLRNQSYNVTFWAWFIHNSKDYKPDASTEIINAHSYNKDNSSTTVSKGQVIWSVMRFAAKIAHHWDTSNFPFDHQILQFFLDDAEHDYSTLRYVADVHNSKIDTDVVLADWNITDFNIKTGPKTYQTTYGDPELTDGSSTFSKITASITLERKGTRLFVSICLAFYIAFLLSTVAFSVPIENISARLSLATGAIFAAIGNKYVVDSMLPPTTSLTLVDKIQVATFLYIGIMVFVTVTGGHVGSRREAIMGRFNDYGRDVLPWVYTFLNIYWVYTAIQNH